MVSIHQMTTEEAPNYDRLYGMINPWGYAMMVIQWYAELCLFEV